MKSRQEIERLSRQKKKTRLMLILLCAMVVLVTAAIILINVIPENEVSNPKPNLPQILPGEAIYNNYPIAYPSIEESQVQSIIVTNKATYKNNPNEDGTVPKTSYMLFRDKEADGKFILSYEDKNGNAQLYYPDVVGLDVSFDYESLYSIEQNDGYSRIPKLTYLCIALELPYFTDRIALLPEGEEREKQLKRFGLNDEDSTEIVFTYKYNEKDADGKTIKDQNGNPIEKTATKKLVIGKKNVTNVGYYFMVGDVVDGKVTYREYVYNSMADYYNYAMLGFYSYVNSILVSAGLAEDTAFEPYLTTDYKQWINEVTKIEEGKEIPEIPEGSKVIVYSEVFTPLESVLDVPEEEKKQGVLYDSDVPEKNKDGYSKENAVEMEIDLAKNAKEYKRLVNALVGKKLGKFEKDIIVTLTSDSKEIPFGEETSLEYKYEIIKIEAILTDGADVTDGGTEVGQNNLIKAAYYLTVGGKRVSNIPYHGVFDLTNAAFDTVTVDKIRAAKVGELSESITLTVNYTQTNSIKTNIKYVIKEIVAIYDSKGKEIQNVAEDSIVCYRWCIVINGEEQEYENGYVDFSDKETNELEKDLKIRLIGKAIEKNLYIKFFETDAYCEYVKDFMTYNIKSAEYFITSKLVSAFKFLNNSERDPFYGESIYENTMDNEYALYAINSSACEAVAKKLGGIGETTGSSAGLVGLETVAVGITPSVKEAYGLYAHTVYFELPRGIIVVDSGDENEVDDYDHYSRLGFTLYISDPVYDEALKTYIRHVGSDLYDIVAKVKAEELEFLDYSFVDFWARRSIMMFDVRFVEEMKVEFMMKDLKGSYFFHVPHNSKSGNTFEVRVQDMCKHEEGCGCTKTNLSSIIQETGAVGMDITQLYNKYLGDEEGVLKNNRGDVMYSKTSSDTAGVAYFKEVVAIMFSTAYDGVMTEEEQSYYLANAPLLMRISLKLDMQMAENTTDNTHVYEFYRCDDRRVMVRLYEVDKDGNMTEDGDVMDFYVTTLAFKKIIANYFALLNGERFDTETAYPDVSK